ncbi:hypothetical protein LTR78_007537 [Recurvomyces mirabilis]|uniref:Glutamine amidotransferase type-2 domain-containing protein n=1 Tax=Recurvomyces mirabilis TaxID=574656 RepID=A0AAE0TU37_9PEZI|nr:hypothetical protein LTR78_007537 [Recurvomyces mirabilis]KAK5159952.1 hypothetical protein LTS14_002058 [Recurvomyces mirabilis]
MCGIFAAISDSQHIRPSPELEQQLQQRGPDSTGQHKASHGEHGPHVSLHATVLSLRGDHTVHQPISVGTSGSALCWNGEAWSIAGLPTSGNDTLAVARLLENIAGEQNEAPSRGEAIIARARNLASALSQIAGPYAFVFHDAANNLLFYGRDFLGRRSLLSGCTEMGNWLLCSVTAGTPNTSWQEIGTDGVYCLDLLQAKNAGNRMEEAVSFAAYSSCEPREVTDDSKTVIPKLSLNLDLPAQDHCLNAKSQAVEHLQKLLRRALAVRIDSIPVPPCLQSGEASSPRTRLAILFSGGLDCTVLARLAHDILPMDEIVDLLNVAFENPRVHKPHTESAYELCPDRITGCASYKELQEVCPERHWNFVAINVPYVQTLDHRDQVITLMHPHNTEMDLSISCALYFASRGQGFLSPTPDVLEPYTTSARVLLNGLGADELFGGYQRHATAFARKGYEGLLDELSLDIGRLGKRNLGRDDRVISHWGREARFPYLDEQVLAWAMSVPVNEKCGFGETLPETPNDGSELLEPGKKVLRCLAWKLGMKGVAKEKKRAIQFGARTAKMETGKTKGTTLLS